MMADHLLWRYLAAWDTVVAEWEAKVEGTTACAADGVLQQQSTVAQPEV